MSHASAAQNNRKLDFAHLHLHSVYSLLDGAIRIPELISRVKELGMSSVAVTDHGNMHGTVDFYEEAVKQGVKPIIGCEFYVAPGSRFEKRNADNVADGRAYHLVLLAKNRTGYRNLIKMSSKAYTEGFFYKPRIDYELLAQHSEGVVGLTACLAGEVNRRLMQKEDRKAFELAGHINELLGQGNFFLEIQNHGIPEQKTVAKGAVELSKKTGIPLALTNDSHFLSREDQKAQDILLRIGMNKTMEDKLDFGFNEEFYVKSPEEMFRLFPELPEAFYNTLKISEMVDLQMDFGHPLLPDFQTPGDMSLKDYLRYLTTEGLKKKFNGNSVPAKYRERLDYELGVIGNMGFDGYFLIVYDFIRFAKESAIPVGPGRGSAAGSLVAYTLGITDLDPLRYDLLFERFLNPSRNEMPDIDIDFCRDRREEVINYVIDKYGDDHVSQIVTFGTLSAKAVIKDVARVLGFPFSDVNSLSKNLSDQPGISLDKAIEEAPDNIKKWFQSGEKEKQLLEIAQKLEGTPRNSGKHAAGVVIAPDPLDEIIPLAKDTGSGAVISQFEKGALEKAGLVKMDFLGLKNLTILQTCVDEIEKRHGRKIVPGELPLNDRAAYQILQDGRTKGIFQVESPGITRLLMQAKPTKFEDIVAVIALYRPGPLESGMTEAYVQRKNGQKKVEYPHENLKPVLEDTFGTIVYQEQIMLIAQVVGGFSLAEADILRKAMGKKKINLMNELGAKFVAGAVERSYDKKWAADLYDKMGEFAKYGFNKSHSAAYGLITYQTAYLKAHYPAEFMKASLDADIETTDKLIGFIFECRKMGIDILPPDVNESGVFFTVIDDKTIRYGLLGLKGIGRSAIEAIVRARKEGGVFKNIIDFVVRVEARYVNRKALEALILSGAFESLGSSRAALFEAIDDIIKYGSKAQQDKLSGQESLFGGGTDEHFEVAYRDEWDADRLLEYEKQTLGLYLTSHPLSEFARYLPFSKVTTIGDLDDGQNERRVTLMAVIEEAAYKTNRKGTSFKQLVISDLTGRAQLRVYSNLVSQVGDELLTAGTRILAEVKVLFFRDSDATSMLLTAEKVSRADEIADVLDKSLHLFIPGESVRELQPKLMQVKSSLQKFRGENPVFIHYRDDESKLTSVKVHPSYFVKFNDEIDHELSDIIGSEKYIAWRIGHELKTSAGVVTLTEA